MATQSTILAWRIPWTEEPGGLQSMGLQRVRHDWATKPTQLSESSEPPFFYVLFSVSFQKGFEMGLQQTYQQCKQKCRMRTKKCNLLERYSLIAMRVMWLAWLSLKFGSRLLGRQGQMGCVVNHTCGSKSLLFWTFSEDCGIKLFLSCFFFWGQKRP